MSRKDDNGALLLVGLGLLALSGRRTSAAVADVPWGAMDSWHWPMPDLLVKVRPAARSTVVPGPVRYPARWSQEYRGADAGAPHHGVDMMYRRRWEGDPSGVGTELETLSEEEQPGRIVRPGNRDWFVPRGTPVYAARSGILWSCSLGKRGWHIVLDHKAGHHTATEFATYYTHLGSTTMPLAERGKVTDTRSTATKLALAGAGALRKGEPLVVEKGQLLGTVGGDPLDPARLRHLHFEVWYRGAGNQFSVDPTSALGHWPRSEWLVPDLALTT